MKISESPPASEILMISPERKKNRPKIGIYLKPRDVEVLKALWRYRVMRESTIHRLCFPTVKHQRKAQDRLKTLYEEGYIGRHFPPIVHRDNKNDGRKDKQGGIYWIERPGMEVVLDSRPFDDRHRERLRTSKDLSQWKEHRLKHPLDLSEVRACLELAVERAPGVRLAAWWDEHDKDEQGPLLQAKVKIPYEDKGRDRSFTHRPDACFILQDERSKKEALFFVEIDEGTESGKKRWRDKVLAYLAYQTQGFENDFAFNGRFFRVLTVTRSQAGKEQGKRKENLLRITYNVGGRGRFLFATFGQVMPDGIETGEYFLTRGIWRRAREEDIKSKTEIVLYNHLFTAG